MNNLYGTQFDENVINFTRRLFRRSVRHAKDAIALIALVLGGDILIYREVYGQSVGSGRVNSEGIACLP